VVQPKVAKYHHQYAWPESLDKVTYTGSDSLLSNVPKNNCSCSGTGTASLTYQYANANNTPLSLISSILSLNQTPIRVDSTQPNGTVQHSGLPANVYNLSINTNLTWNGVSATDALLTSRHFANLTQFTEIQKLAADVNLSASINATDALLISRRFTGIITAFPCGDWVVHPNKISVLGSQTATQTIKVLNSGDINGSRVGW
jgi:hypothetical protein